MRKNVERADSMCENASSIGHGKSLSVLALLLVAIFAFVLGNSSPPLRAWLPGLIDPQPPEREATTKELSRKNPLNAGSPKDLAAEWSTLRDKTDQELHLAERILNVMRDRALPEADVHAQKEKVDELRNRLDHCDKRLHELVEHNVQSGKVMPNSKDEISPEELDIQHRQVIDQWRLKKIVPNRPSKIESFPD